MDSKIQKLKLLGHQLLDEYISLDIHRGLKVEKRHAYKKLESKLKENKTPHFSLMTSEKEVQEVIVRLISMIRKRKNKLEIMAKDKIKFAPNLAKLQKQANKLNKNI